MLKFNPLTALDFYKTGHPFQYPANTEFVYSNMTARSNKHFQWQQAGRGYVILWGIRGFIQEFLIEGWNEGFFSQPRDKCVAYFKRRMKNSVGEITTAHIEALHDLGFLPIQVKSLPEGTKVPIGVPMFTMVNTNPNFGWLTNSLETVTSTELWKPITIATIAYEYDLICQHYAGLTCDNNDHVIFQCHDFSMRGIGGWHSASAHNSGHLLPFRGTDTVSAIDYLEQYYDANSDVELVGASVPATEHSVMCMGSKTGEQATVERLLTDVYPTGIFSCVLDTWDFFKVLTEMLPALKDKIMSRDGKFVVRPDSGDPVDIICGLKYIDVTSDIMDENLPSFVNPVDDAFSNGYKVVKLNNKYYDINKKEISEAQAKGAIELLWETFGGTINSKGYKVLDSHIGLIYGDSITLERADEILKRLESKGFASSNVVFGVGSFTYQYITRDTFGMAIKATWGQINGEPIDIQKDPATDDGTKKSLKGRVMVYQGAKGLEVKDECSAEEEESGLLQLVLRNGVTYNTESLQTIRERLASQ